LVESLGEPNDSRIPGEEKERAGTGERKNSRTYETGTASQKESHRTIAKSRGFETEEYPSKGKKKGRAKQRNEQSRGR